MTNGGHHEPGPDVKKQGQSDKDKQDKAPSKAGDKNESQSSAAKA